MQSDGQKKPRKNFLSPSKSEETVQFLPVAGEENTRQQEQVAEAGIIELAGLAEEVDSGDVCCGGPAPPRSNPFEKPGYELKGYVRAFLRKNGDDIPLVKTSLDRRDRLGTLLARLGINRDDYRVPPGLYGTGSPDADSPVLVTANYKLSFDFLRRELAGIDCWLLVLDTCGVNVWCAAGKNTFSTDELVRQVENTRLAEKVNHRRLIVPQLGATGVAAHHVKLKCGFRVVYGPVRSSDIGQFLDNDMQASEKMRSITFTLWERFELIPVEFYIFGKKIWWVFPLLFLLAAPTPDFLSLTDVWRRGLLSSGAIILGAVSGAMIVPLLLPWIPGRSFAVKGALSGLLFGGLLAWLSGVRPVEGTGLLLVFTAISSYLAMNFTGSTPYTSPTGVEKEMKGAIPLQICALAAGVLMWLAGPFV